MTDTMNEIMCECGHSERDHNIDVCLALDERGEYICDCMLGREDVFRSRLSALQTEVEGRGETIKKWLDDLENVALSAVDHVAMANYASREAHAIRVIHEAFDHRRALLAATAPVEGGDTNNLRSAAVQLLQEIYDEGEGGKLRGSINEFLVRNK